MHALYIDDLTEAEGVDLKKEIIRDPVQRPFPLNFHERTQHIFPNEHSLLQKQLNKVELFTQENKMKINESKTKIMIFNKSRKYDFPPEYSFSNNDILEVVEETRLLGIIITSDLRWEANTLSICTKAMAKMWLLRRMKIMKIDQQIIFDYYMKEIRVLAEQGVAIWNSGLTKGQIKDLEKIQKVALKVILGDGYRTYELALDSFEITPLFERRFELCKNFALKLYQSDRSCDFFSHSTKTVNSRHDQPPLLENLTRTTRAYNAPHNYLTRLVNQNTNRIK